MLRLSTHIERLLFVHDCVIIPGIGGFVLQAVPATYRKEDNTFFPMRKEIVFNTALQHNDGLLAESYMQSYQVDYRKAQSMLEDDIAEVKMSLQQYKKASLGHIGSLTLNTENNILYQTGRTGMFDVDYYGLSTFQFPALPALAEKDTAEDGAKRKKDIFYIPVNMRFIRGAVASAAAIALFLLISTPVKDVQQSAYTASILPREILMPKTADANKTPIIEEAGSPTEVLIETPAPTVTNKKMFHIIIGSFPNQEKADEYMEGVDKSLYQGSGMIIRDDRYRVYASKFDNRQEAENYLSVIRESDKYKDAWLFISR